MTSKLNIGENIAKTQFRQFEQSLYKKRYRYSTIQFTENRDFQIRLQTCMRVYKMKIEAHTCIKDVAIMPHTQLNYKGSREINEVY